MKDLLIIGFNDPLGCSQQIGDVLSGRGADLDGGDIIGIELIVIVATEKCASG
jgi:hypothetical protein